MKKYLLGLLAILLAVGFSSFKAPAKPVKKSLAVYYWYEVDASGFVQGTTLNPGGEINKATAISTYRSDCTDVFGEPFCILGSHDPDLDLGNEDQITGQGADATVLMDDE